MYHKGEGVAKDIDEVRNWFHKAAEQRDELANT
ncbi:MAG: SEL1-like repeat protein, partial [Synergistaceae bacterium]|nr:SEL1-like repeat protein [Synergistaceae bacterium]